MTDKRFTKVKHIFELNDEGIKDNQTKIEYYYALDLIDLLNELATKCSQLEKENEELKEFKKKYDIAIVDYNNLACRFDNLKKEKDSWKNDACSKSSYLSILSMDCQIVEEALLDLKNVIDVDTEVYNLLDELSDKFDDLQRHRLKT